MRWRYLPCNRRLLVWDAPDDVAMIRSLLQGNFNSDDVTAIVFYDAAPTTIVLRGRFLDRIIWGMHG